ncbi:MAG: tail fiber domain-containing protein [Bacteroidaceae bacterium]|nr:tail fiber domain-containing protein [Bacteroidaceae bacterium]
MRKICLSTMQYYSKLYVLTILLLLSCVVDAQIIYTKGKLTYGDVEQHKFLPITLKAGGTYWTLGNKFFQLDLRSDKVCLAGTGDKIYFVHTLEDKHKIIYDKIHVADCKITSDSRAKKNVKSLGGGLNNLLRLRPVKFNWKKDEDPDVIVDGKNFAIGPKDDNDQYGFLAQEVEDIMPDIVHTSEEGEKGVNYIALIPMLVESIQELNAKVAEQSRRIEQMSSHLPSSLVKKLKNSKIISCKINGENIYIEYNVASNVKNAYVIIKSLHGQNEKTILLTQSSNTYSESVSELKSGIHVVILVVDGIHCDSKLITVSSK